MPRTKKVTAVTIVSLVSLLTGILVIMGWEFHISGLQTVFPGYISMKFNAAICFIVLGAALLLTQFQFKKYNTLAILVLSFLAILIGLLSVSEYLFHFDAAIDQLFIADAASIVKKYAYPGRMPPGTAICFILFGLSFFGFSTKSRLFQAASQYLLHAVTAVSAMAIVGYLYGLSLFYNAYLAGSMAIHTAVLFFFLSIIASLAITSLQSVWHLCSQVDWLAMPWPGRLSCC